MVMVKEVAEVPGREVRQPGIQGVWIRRLISQADHAPTFAMRLFEVAPGGYTPLHTHDHEHEVFVLSGRGVVKGPWGQKVLGPESVVFIPPREEHHFVNMGEQVLRFLCLVPVEADV